MGDYINVYRWLKGELTVASSPAVSSPVTNVNSFGFLDRTGEFLSKALKCITN
jgi:hypothetical protein